MSSQKPETPPEQDYRPLMNSPLFTELMAEWQSERERIRDMLEVETDIVRIAHLQGRVANINEQIARVTQGE